MPYSVEFDTPVPAAQLPNYRERLNRWEIIRIRPNVAPVVVARFRSRSDADGHLDFLRQQIPTGEFVVSFNPQ